MKHTERTNVTRTWIRLVIDMFVCVSLFDSDSEAESGEPAEDNGRPVHCKTDSQTRTSNKQC